MRSSGCISGCRWCATGGEVGDIQQVWHLRSLHLVPALTFEASVKHSHLPLHMYRVLQAIIWICALFKQPFTLSGAVSLPLFVSSPAAYDDDDDDDDAVTESSADGALV